MSSFRHNPMSSSGEAEIEFTKSFSPHVLVQRATAVLVYGCKFFVNKFMKPLCKKINIENKKMTSLK